MKKYFLIFLFFAIPAPFAVAQESTPAVTVTATIDITQDEMNRGYIRSQNFHKPEDDTSATVDVNQLLQDTLDRRIEQDSGADTESATEDGGGVQLPTTTPFSEDILVAPNTVNDGWEGPLNTIQETVITNENSQRALQTPLLAKMRNGTLIYDYKRTGKYLIFLTPRRISAIHLEPGEKLSSEPAVSDSQLLNVQYAKVGRDEDPEQQIIILVSSNFAQSDGTIIITTDRRIYHIIVISSQDFATEIVHFSYPDSESVPQNFLAGGDDTTNPSTRTPVRTDNGGVAPASDSNGDEKSYLRRIIPDEIQFDYMIKNPCDTDERDCDKFGHEQNEKIRPDIIYDDGLYTYFGWHDPPPRLPAFFARDSEGLLTPISYISKDRLYIIQQTFHQGILMLNKDVYLVIDNEN